MSNRDSFTALELAFFRAGAESEREREPIETFADLDEGYQPKSLLKRLFARKPTRQ